MIIRLQPPPAPRLAAAVVALVASPAAFAQAPPQPLRVILPVGPGSGVDIIVRSAQPSLSRALGGQPVVIENLPGAGGITGTQALIKAAPRRQHDRLRLQQPRRQPERLQEDAVRRLADVTPITVVGGSPFVLVVNPSQGAGDERQGTADLSQGQARRLQLRLVRQWHHHPPGR